MMRCSLRAGVGLALVVALGFLLASCGGSETTVTVTETAANPAKNGGGSKSNNAKVQKGAVAGYVDFSKVDGDTLIVSGWAASKDLAEPATGVAAEVDGKTVAEAVPALQREDVVDALGKPGLLESGYELRLPIESLDCGAVGAGVKVVGSLNGMASVLPYGEGIKEALTEAC